VPSLPHEVSSAETVVELPAIFDLALKLQSGIIQDNLIQKIIIPKSILPSINKVQGVNDHVTGDLGNVRRKHKGNQDQVKQSLSSRRLKLNKRVSSEGGNRNRSQHYNNGNHHRIKEISGKRNRAASQGNKQIRKVLGSGSSHKKLRRINKQFVHGLERRTYQIDQRKHRKTNKSYHYRIKKNFGKGYMNPLAAKPLYL